MSTARHAGSRQSSRQAAAAAAAAKDASAPAKERATWLPMSMGDIVSARRRRRKLTELADDTAHTNAASSWVGDSAGVRLPDWRVMLYEQLYEPEEKERAETVARYAPESATSTTAAAAAAQAAKAAAAAQVPVPKQESSIARLHGGGSSKPGTASSSSKRPGAGRGSPRVSARKGAVAAAASPPSSKRKAATSSLAVTGNVDQALTSISLPAIVTTPR
jgi:hypothetical protein